MRWWFAFGGGILGLLWGISGAVASFVTVPSMPGPFEMMLQLVIVGVLCAFGIAGGFVVGCLVDLFSRRKKG